MKPRLLHHALAGFRAPLIRGDGERRSRLQALQAGAPNKNELLRAAAAAFS